MIKIGIHHQAGSYSGVWINYCQQHHIDYKVVNSYDTDIVDQLKDCDIFMWHFHQMNYRDMNFAKQLLFSLEQAGKIVFPNFKTGWHFDDKLGQKYLFEANGIHAAPSFVFYDKSTALEWARKTTFPKVFKLRGGAGGYNVRLIKSRYEAKRCIRRAFGHGWKSYDKFYNAIRLLIELFKRSATLRQFLGSCSLLFRHTPSDLLPDHRGYVYFQEFIPTDGFDYRIEICGDKAIAMIRYCRKGDFRASGSHLVHHENGLVEQDVIQYAFEVADKLHLQSAAIDIVRHKDTGEIYVVENSYCYGVDEDEFDHGYWTKDGVYHNEPFNGIEWMLEKAIEDYNISHKI